MNASFIQRTSCEDSEDNLPPTTHRIQSQTHAQSSVPSKTDSQFLRLETRAVLDAPLPSARPSDAFLCTHTTTPRAVKFLHALRSGEHRLVEVEVGRYDRLPSSLDSRIEVPLGGYLDWLTGRTDTNGSADGNEKRGQLYLAQWRARDDVPAVSKMVHIPRVLSPLLRSSEVDLYQSSFFVGPAGAITPLHCDPYHNLYQLLASSQPAIHAKHILLLPPSLADVLASTANHISRNTSPLDIRVQRTSAAISGFHVYIDRTSASARTTEAVLHSGSALTCVLREGDMLFLPRGWWHRVENIVMGDWSAEEENNRTRGWTAGVGWWFLPRKLQQ
ncbi:hypothetical protein C8Q80DRAFT_1220114 [Daedaleopsis nitida]|nr:hypothetical protein C8Q80DRAFT_1220114 [Daedaleopsis nitida]